MDLDEDEELLEPFVYTQSETGKDALVCAFLLDVCVCEAELTRLAPPDLQEGSSSQPTADDSSPPPRGARVSSRRSRSSTRSSPAH